MQSERSSTIRKTSSSFRSLAELLLPIAVVRDVVQDDALPVMSHEQNQPCRENVEMPMESVAADSRDVVGTITGQLNPMHPAAGQDFSHQEAALHDIETFRVYAIETIERSLERLLISMAEEVLGRELLLAPADVQEIARRALRRYDREGPIRLRISAADLGHVQSELPVVVDNDLNKGDLIVEVREGMLDSRMDIRLDCVVRRFLSNPTSALNT